MDKLPNISLLINLSKIPILILVNLLSFFYLKPIIADSSKNILVLHSYHNDLFWTNQLKEGINEGFDNSKHEVNISHEFLDAKRNPNLEYSQLFLAYLKQRYLKKNPIDILIVSDDPGLELVLNNREQYFPNIPIVFLGINHVRTKLLETPNMTGVFENRDVSETILEAYSQTKSNTLIALNDTTETGVANSDKIQEAIAQNNSFKEVKIINDLSPDRIEEEFRNISSEKPVLFIGQLRKNNQNSALLNFEPSIEILRSKIKNPIYGVTIELLNRGIVGGKFLEGKLHAQEAVGLAEKILDGISIKQIKPIIKAENRWIFDAQELKKQKIELDSLPKNSKIVNLQPSFYDKHRRLVLITIVAFGITLSIILLLIEILRRRSITEKIVRENEIRYKDLAQAGASVFWEIDTNSKFNYISGDTQNIYNKKPLEILDKTLQEIFQDDTDLDFAWNSYQEIIKNRKPFDNFIFSIKKGHEIKIFQLNGKPIYDRDRNFLGYRGIKREITQEYNLSQTIAYQASYDSLTGLINRREFNNHLKVLVEKTKRSQNSSVLCFLDLDRFKFVNDTAGHSVGDALLVELANLLKSCIRANDILGRLGGDEFALLLVNTSIVESKTICQNIIDKVDKYKYSWNHRLFDVGISIGLLPIDSNVSNTTEILSKADLACYKAKELGRGRLYVSNHQDRNLSQDRLQMEYIANVSQAIERQQFYLVKQPIKSIFTERQNYQHYEILLRYIDDRGNIISPASFIPLAEKYGVIASIDRWVLDTVINNYESYFPDLQTMVSINLSGITINNEEFIDYAISLIETSIIDPNYICFEITETAAVSQISQATKFMLKMKSYGIKFALDDFGSGFSSFEYLKNLPIDYLKLDGSLIKNIVTDNSDRAIVSAINSIAQMMNMETIAEFVENDQILDILVEIGINYAQGYGIGKPIKIDKQLTNKKKQSNLKKLKEKS